MLLLNHPNSVIFRLSNVFGGSNQKNRTILSDWKESALTSSEIVIWGEGRRKMQYVHIADVLNCINISSKIKPGIYNLGSDDYIRISDVVQIMSDEYNVKVKYLSNKKERVSLPMIQKTYVIRIFLYSSE